MGRLYYGNTTDAIELPDQLLAHLKVVAMTKLRRSESFSVSWRDRDNDARSSIWVHCSIPLRFEFDSAEAEQLDREYLAELAQSAASNGGIMFDLASSAKAVASIERAELGRAA